jgi:dipeptidyl aminopeptidase/acylaminoacyl peptidase
MSDLKILLERADRAVADVPLPAGGLDGLERRRERKQRNRRIRAGAVGVIVALATGIVLFRSITSGPIPVDRPAPTKPLGVGEVLIGGSASLVAQDPESGDGRTIVDAFALPGGAGEFITGAKWSFDHKWVAFRRGSGSMSGELWVVDSIGGAPRRLASVGGYSQWAWSPTEDELVLARGQDVILIDAATGSETDLGTAIGARYWGEIVHALAWSPDGSRIVYDGGPGSGSVYSIDVESGEHSLLVGEPAGAGEIKDLDWSPDGAHLAISYYSRTWARQALYVANTDGSGLRLVVHGSEVGVAWSPDGTRLAYTNFKGPDPDPNLEVWTVSVHGSAPSLVASQCCVTGGAGVVWSPDGSQIAFETEFRGGTPNVHLEHPVVNADGTGDDGKIDELTYRSWDGGSYFCGCYG